ncbi:MAG: beta-propeller domain-containing protein, partial [Propionibacteriaceae bacterium]|nr:beta-propeller domain-containing protein [Propionibacteriaceae bacterium]
MSEKDDYLAGFQGLRSQMTPSPELLARLEAALEGREVAPTATTPTDSRPSKKAERGKGRKAEPTPAPDPEVTPEATPAIVVGEVDEPIDSADQASEVVVTPATDEPTPDPEPPTALSEPHPAPTPKTDTQPLAKPAYKRPRYQRIKSRGLRWGIGIGGLVSALLAAVMILPQFVASPGQTSTWPQWPDPTVIKDRPGTTNPQGGQYNLADYEAIYRALAATGTKDVLATDGEPAPMPEGDTSSRPAPTAPGAGDSKDDSGNFSGTNTQVAGIDEGDIVKTDGSYLYIAKGRSVAIVTAEGANSRQLSTIDTSGLASADELLVGPVADLMINGSTLVVLLHGFEADLDGWSRASGTWFSAEATTLKAALYDISNPEKPRYLSMITQSGSYLSSRLSDGVLYLVSTYWVWEASVDPSDPTTYVPTVDCGNGPVAVSPRDVKILPGVDQPSYTVVTAIDVDSRDLLSEQAILGRTDTVYMSPDNLYLATNQWNWAVPLDDSPRPRVPGFEGEYDGSRTDIVRIGLNDGALAIEATGSVAGFPRDQFALDELDGNLRMVTTWQDTTLDWWAPIAALWVLDADLNLIGSLPRLA